VARLGGVVTAKFDTLVPADVLRECWVAGNAAAAALVPEAASSLLAADQV